VVALHSGFHETQIVQRPVQPMESAVFYLPARSDYYKVQVRVSFEDGRLDERTIRFDVWDWQMVSLGDSFALGAGQPALPEHTAGKHSFVAKRTIWGAQHGKMVDSSRE